MPSLPEDLETSKINHCGVTSQRFQGSYKPEKNSIRTRVWRVMEELGISKFPRPVFGRIPNFVGAERAAERLASQPEFRNAETVKVNPDSPQAMVRRLALLNGKALIMPTPRLKRGFILLDPEKIPRRLYFKASTIKGAFKYGKLCPLSELPKVDLVVVGSVAVSRDGVRVGKGGGYSEIEYAVLRELGLIEEETPVLTTVHDVQIVEWAPLEPHDLVVDAIVTPSRILRVERTHSRPGGIIWEKLSDEMIREMPVLSELGALKGKVEGRPVQFMV